MSKKSKELKNDNRIYLNKSNILKLGMKEKAELIYEAIEAWKLSYTDYVNSYLSLFSYDFVFPSDSLGTLKGTYYSALDDSKIKYEVITYISSEKKAVYTMASGVNNAYDIDGSLRYHIEDWDGKFVNINYLSYPINVFSDFISLLKRIKDENYTDIELDVAELLIRDEKYYRVNYTDIDGSFRSVMMTSNAKILDITVVIGTNTYILKNFKYDRKLPDFVQFVANDEDYLKLQNLGLV